MIGCIKYTKVQGIGYSGRLIKLATSEPLGV